MRVAFTPEAQRDLLDIVLYLDDRNPKAARQTLQNIRARCLSLADHPRRGAVIDLRGEEEIRRVLEYPFIIAYTCSDELVSILRDLHGARDFHHILDTLLGSEPD